jgi:hypothetical protein
MQNPLISIIFRATLSAGFSCALQPQAAAFTMTHDVSQAFEGREGHRHAPTSLYLADFPGVLRTLSPRPE